jgi:RNA methyltransferase, TrmH family
MAESTITSPRNPRVLAAAGLRSRRRRDEAGLTLVDGERELQRALEGGAAVVEVFVCEARLRETGRAAVEQARHRGAAIVPVEDPVLDRLAYGDREAGVVAVTRIPAISLDAITLGRDPLLVVVEGIEKPGNLGAILRTADAVGAAAVVAADPRTDLFNPNAIRASVGTIFAIPVAQAPAADVRSWLLRAGIAIVAARVDGAIDYTAADLHGPLAIVLGSEAAGLGDAWTGDDVTAVRLPMRGVADSLNVSIAAAVLLFEARRQRGETVDRGVDPTGFRSPS